MVFKKTVLFLLYCLAYAISLGLLATDLSTTSGHDRGRGRSLVDKRLVDVRDDTTTGDGGFDEGVELLVTSDGQKQMSGGDTLHLEILASISSELKHLSSQVLHDGGGVDGSGSTNSLVRVDSGLEKSVDTANREL